MGSEGKSRIAEIKGEWKGNKENETEDKKLESRLVEAETSNCLQKPVLPFLHSYY